MKRAYRYRPEPEIEPELTPLGATADFFFYCLSYLNRYILWPLITAYVVLQALHRFAPELLVFQCVGGL